jgi:hypothetical protein
MTKEHSNKEWLRTRVILTKQGNQAMYLYMEGHSLQAVGNIMGLSRTRILQLVQKYQRHCMQEGQVNTPRRNEVDELLPHIDSIKSIYEN